MNAVDAANVFLSTLRLMRTGRLASVPLLCSGKAPWNGNGSFEFACNVGVRGFSFATFYLVVSGIPSSQATYIRFLYLLTSVRSNAV
jgi:hypothetical protein